MNEWRWSGRPWLVEGLLRACNQRFLRDWPTKLWELLSPIRGTQTRDGAGCTITMTEKMVPTEIEAMVGLTWRNGPPMLKWKCHYDGIFIIDEFWCSLWWKFFIELTFLFQWTAKLKNIIHNIINWFHKVFSPEGSFLDCFHHEKSIDYNYILIS